MLILIHQGFPNMLAIRRTAWLLLVLAVLVVDARGDDRPAPPNRRPGGDAARVYGEWRIRVKPDQGPALQPAHRTVGAAPVPRGRRPDGRLVEHPDRRPLRACDDLGIRRHGGLRAGDPVPVEKPGLRPVRRRARPAAGRRREPVPAAGPGAARPSLPEPAPFVVHEIHRVPLARKDAYLAYMTRAGPRPAQGQRLPPGRSLGRRRRPMVRGHLPLPVRQPGRARAADRQVFARPRTHRHFDSEDRRIRRGDHDPPAGPGAVRAQATRPRAAAKPERSSASAAAPRAARPGGPRGRLFRPLPLRQLRLGRAGRARRC